MNKEEFIEKYGGAAYEKRLAQAREWRAAHREEHNALCRKWRAANPDKVKAQHQEQSCKGGKRYKKKRAYQMSGIPHEKSLVRKKHEHRWAKYKHIIAPDSQIHHEWIPDTADYRGVALVEKDTHMHGYIDVIQILDGKITLLTEKEVRR